MHSGEMKHSGGSCCYVLQRVTTQYTQPVDHLMVTHWSESRTPWVGSAVQITTWRLLRDGDRIYVPVGVCMRIGAGTLTSLDCRLSGAPRRPGVYSCCKVSHCSQLTERWPSCVVPNRWAGHVSTTLKLSKV